LALGISHVSLRLQKMKGALKSKDVPTRKVCLLVVYSSQNGIEILGRSCGKKGSNWRNAS